MTIFLIVLASVVFLTVRALVARVFSRRVGGFWKIFIFGYLGLSYQLIKVGGFRIL